MKTLDTLAQEVRSGEVLKIHFTDGHSYIGRVVRLRKRYLEVSPLGSPRTERIHLSDPELRGRKIAGYEAFDGRRNQTPHEY